MLSDAQVWQDWLQWLPTAAPSDRPAPIFGQYHRKLTEAGASEAEADNQVAAILRLMRTQTDGWQAFYNNIYANPSPGFNTHPNALLVSAVAGRPPGRALDVGTGQGRNAVFLATQGWDVTAVDLSDEGLEIARRNAERAGVHLRTVLAGNDAFDFGTATWDLMVMTYVPVPLTTSSYVKRISDALRPGGLIVIESFASDATEDGRTPVDIDPADLQRAFAGFRVLHFADTLAMPDWLEDETRLAQLIAKKQRDTTGVA
jgi:predicted O-methyltransferase YrrM